jgi:hypothetical protein
MLGIITRKPRDYKIRNIGMVIQTPKEFIKMNAGLFKEEDREQ